MGRPLEVVVARGQAGPAQRLTLTTQPSPNLNPSPSPSPSPNPDPNPNPSPNPNPNQAGPAQRHLGLTLTPAEWSGKGLLGCALKETI